MKDEKLGQSPAYPVSNLEMRGFCGNEQVDGISKRFYAACMAMQGIIQSESFMKNQRESGVSKTDFVAYWSYRMADEILRQELL